MKVLTLEDYQKAGEHFWPKYFYVAEKLGEDAKPEDILKVMEAVGKVALVQDCLLYTSPSPRDQRGSRMPSSA